MATSRKNGCLFISLGCAYLVFTLILAACAADQQISLPMTPSPEATATKADLAVTATLTLPTNLPTQTRTYGPTPTCTDLPPLQSNSWLAAPIMVEAARIRVDPNDPFRYTPLLLLYGDGTLIKRECQEDQCQHLQTQLETVELCRLINAIDRTGFLHADPKAFSVPGETGSAIRMSVHLYEENLAEIPDLDRWIESPEWYEEVTGCTACFSPAEFDPAIIQLYHLLTTYADVSLSGVTTDRLALWLSRPVIAGLPKSWSEELVSLSELERMSTCQENPEEQQAVILEGSQARAVSGFLSLQGGKTPVFTDGETTWQINSRWLLPYEMPKTCQLPADLYPPPFKPEKIWQCNPEMGVIPTPTPTITLTPTITSTPLR